MQDLIKLALSVIVYPFGSGFAVRVSGASEMHDEVYLDQGVTLARAQSSARALRRVLVLAAADHLTVNELVQVLTAAEDPVGFVVGEDFRWRNLDDYKNRPFRVAVLEDIRLHPTTILYAAHPSGVAKKLPIQGREEALEEIRFDWRRAGSSTHFEIYLDPERKIAVDTLEVG